MSEKEEYVHEEKHQKHSEEERKKFDVELTPPVLLLLAIVLIGGMIAGFALNMVLVKPIPNDNATGAIIVSEADLKEKVTTYLNDNFFEMQGLSANITSIEQAEDANDFYVIKFDITKGKDTLNKGAEIYATKNGKNIIIGSILNLDKPLEFEKDSTENNSQQQTELAKQDVPNLKLFVMSFCPYGILAETIVKPVLELFGDKVEFEPHYIVYSDYCGYGVSCKQAPEERATYCLDAEKEIPLYCGMHGVGEVHEDIRQLVIWKYYPDKWWDYVSAIAEKYHQKEVNSAVIDEKWEEIATSIGLDVEEIKKHAEEEGIELLQEQTELMVKYNANGSPTYILNEKQIGASGSSKAFKQTLCASFTNAPEECKETLSNSTQDTTTDGCGV